MRQKCYKTMEEDMKTLDMTDLQIGGGGARVRRRKIQ